MKVRGCCAERCCLHRRRQRRLREAEVVDAEPELPPVAVVVAVTEPVRLHRLQQAEAERREVEEDVAVMEAAEARLQLLLRLRQLSHRSICAQPPWI